MWKKRTAAVILLAGIFLAGCGKGEAENNQGTGETDAGTAAAAAAETVEVEVLKDGSVIETLTEAFEAEYYNEENLKNMVLSEVADFNKQTLDGDGDISVEKFESKNGSITVRMKYPSSQMYTEYNTDQYNQKSLFCGTIAEAYDAGYTLDLTMKDSKGEKTVGKEELLKMGEDKILIAEAPMHVTVPGKILYIGENIVPSGKNQADMQAGENGEALGKYYVIYK